MSLERRSTTDLSTTDDVEVIDEYVGCGNASAGRVDRRERSASTADWVDDHQEDSGRRKELNRRPVDANMSALERSVVTAERPYVNVALVRSVRIVFTRQHSI